MWIVVKK